MREEAVLTGHSELIFGLDIVIDWMSMRCEMFYIRTVGRNWKRGYAGGLG